MPNFNLFKYQRVNTQVAAIYPNARQKPQEASATLVGMAAAILTSIHRAFGVIIGPLGS